MKMTKRLLLLIAVLPICMIAVPAIATPDWGALVGSSYGVSFNDNDTSLLVDCEVFQTGQEYMYTYRLSNEATSKVGISFFSVSIQEGINAYSPGVYEDPFGEEVSPIFYTLSGDPVQSISYMFADTVDAGQTSSLLWFISDTGPGIGQGVVYGSLDGAPSALYTTGELITPSVPEPVSIALLGAGGLFIRRNRKGKIE